MSDATEQLSPALSAPRDWRGLVERIGPPATLLALVVATSLCQLDQGQNTFLTWENLRNILLQWSPRGIMALGMTFVIISGGIDLSVGSLLACAGGIGIWMMNTALNAASILQEMSDAGTANVPAPYSAFRVWLARDFLAFHLHNPEPWAVAIAVVTMLLVGILAGMLNGLLISKGRIPAFIATLGGLAAYRSIPLKIADGGSFNSASANFFPIAGTGGIPIPGADPHNNLPYTVIAFLVLAGCAWILLNKTRYGRYVYAIGSNERAARYSAINVDRVKIITYTLIGLLTGVAAFLVASWTSSVSSSSTGQLYELDVIAAVVIGGTRMEGGAGSIFGTVIGVLILAVIANMLNFLDISPYLQGLVEGVIIVAAIFVQQLGRRKS